MASAGFLAAARQASSEPVVLLAVESVNTIRVQSSSSPDWQAAKASSNVNIASRPGAVYLDTDGEEKQSGTYAHIDAAINEQIHSGTWGGEPPPVTVYTSNYPSPNNRTVRVTADISSFYTVGDAGSTATLQVSSNGGANWTDLGSVSYDWGSLEQQRVISAAVSPGSYLARIKLTPFGSPDETYLTLVAITWNYDTRYLTSGSLQTKSLDLGSVPTIPSRIELDDTIPAGCSLTYSVRGSNDNSTWTNLGAVVDGQSISAYRYYDVTATLTASADKLYSPTVEEIRILGGDSQFEYFSTHPHEPIRGVKPYITKDGISSLTTKIDLQKMATIGELSAKLVWRPDSGDMVATGRLKNKNVVSKIGFVGLSEPEYESFFTGTWHDYGADPDKALIDIKTRNILKKYTRKIPEADYFVDVTNTKISGLYYTLAGNIMQVMLDIADLLGIPDRYLNRTSFEALRDGDRAGADWSISRNLTQPEKADELLNQLLVSAGVLLYEAADGRLTAKLIPDDTTVAVATLDALHHKFGPIEGGQEELTTRQAIYYQLLPGKSGGNAEDFAKCLYYVNAQAELDWGENSTKEILDPWGLSTAAIQQLADRLNRLYANPAAKTKVSQVPIRFIEIEPGAVIAVNNLQLPCPAGDWQGYTVAKKFMVTSKTVNPMDKTLSFDLLELGGTAFSPVPQLPDYSPYDFFPLVTGLQLTQRAEIKPGGGVELFVDVAFTAPSDHNFGVAEVWYSVAGGEWVFVKATPSGGLATSHIIPFLAATDVTYSIAVMTVNAKGIRPSIAQSVQGIITVAPPDPPSAVTNLEQAVIDNIITLSWIAAAWGTFPVDHYRIYSGIDFATAEYRGRFDVTRAILSEGANGTHKYWITAVDTAGQASDPAGIYAKIDQPTDYVLHNQLACNWSAGTCSSAGVELGKLIIPISTTETIDQAYTAQGWTTEQDAINAGAEYAAEIVPTSGTYTEIMSVGATIPNAKITVTITRTALGGTPTMACDLYTGTSSSGPWTQITSGSYEGVGKSFSYVKMVLTATANGGFFSCTEGQVRIDVKERNHITSMNVTDTAGTGTEVTFASLGIAPIDVVGITAQAPYTNTAADPISARINFTDVPNPTSFRVLTWDKNNTRCTTNGVVCTIRYIA